MWTKRFVAWVEKSGLSRTELAYKCGVSAVAVHHWLKDNAIPREAQRKRIAKLSKGAVPADIESVAKAG